MTECLFCRIVSGEIPAEVVATSEHALAFRDINPTAPTHVLVIPTRHVVDIPTLAQAPAELAHLVALGARVAAQEGLDDGNRLVANTGRAGGQVVFHAHLHVIGGRRMGWPPG